MKVRHRLLLVLSVASLSVAVLIASGAFWVVRSAVRERYLERIRAETLLLAEWVDADPRRDLQEFARTAAGKLGLRVTLVGDDGSVLGDSAVERAGLAALDDHRTRPEIRAARSLGSGESFRTSATTTIEYFYAAQMLTGDRRPKFVRVALPSSAVYRVGLHYGLISVAVVAASMVLLTAIAYGAIRRLSHPVEWMTDAVERAAAGDFRLELPRSGGEEVVRLAAAVRRLQSALLGKIAELDSERAVLSSVISGMKEGLLLLGPDHRIRLTNEALRQIFDIEFDPVGHRLTDVVRHPAVVSDVEAALAGDPGETIESVVELAESARSFELQVTPLHSGDRGARDGAVVLLFDITRLEALERVRREFVANVSHELRTPLTAIKAAIETLLDEDTGDSEQLAAFQQIISNNADRMGDLIEDLTDLSLIETGAIALELDTIDGAGVAREVAEAVAPLASSRDVELVVDVPSPFSLRADRRRLTEMLTNLVDNALKFSRPAGHVWIRGIAQDERPVLVVEDDGIGIPSSSLELIFHRFYQVDRDGSREPRGTGLGLAIVKHLMRLHGGSVRVESELGRGARFSLDFPRSA